MSFGSSGGDVFLLAQLAWRTVQNSRKACGEYDELTREALRLHAVLQRLEQEVAKPESPINRSDDTSKEQLERIATDCELVLKQLDKIVTAYASLSDEKRSARKIWQRVRFGNGQMADLGDLRSRLISYTSEMLLYLNLVSMGTMGRIEQRMDRDGGVLRDIKVAVEKKTAHTVLCGGNWEGSVLTAYTNDDTGFWKGLRRDLIKDGLPSAAIKKHKHLIQEYVKELGARGILDDESSKENNEPQHDIHANFDITEEIQEPFNNCNATLNVPQTYEHNIDVQPFEDLTEQSLNEYVNDTITEDVGSESPRAESCPKGSQSIKEQLCSSSDHTGIRMGAKDKSEFDYNNSNALEPLSTDSGPRNLHSAKSVPLRPAKKQSWTSRNETNTNRNDASKAGDAERAIQNDATNHASSHDGYFPQSIAELRRNINFVVTPAGVCHKADMSLLYKNFGQRSKVMLECLPDPSLQVPQTEPGDNPYYAADVEIIANIAQSAQKIIRDMCDCCIRPPVSLIDFRPRHFIDAVNMRPYYQDLQQFYISIHEVIADFDRQFCDIVQRIRRYNAKMKSGYPRYTTPAYPSFTHKDAYDNVPGQQHPSQMYSGGTGEDISSKHSVGAPYNETRISRAIKVIELEEYKDAFKYQRQQ